jgi:hypothetical protein
VSAELGLKINESKCQILIMNSKESQPEMIQNIVIVKSIKYLGVDVDDSRRFFSEHKKAKIEQAKKMSRMTYSMIARSCNKMMIGKTYWKSVVLPSVLHASSVVLWNQGEIDQLQRIENGVWRQILGAPSYAPVTTLQGDTGSSTVKARDMKIKILYFKHLQASNNELLRQIMNEQINMNRPMEYVVRVKKYLEEIGMNVREVNESSIEQVKSKINV